MQNRTFPLEVQRLLNQALRRETPCGDGALVWHIWGAGEPVLMLHGGSGSWTHWIRNIEALVDSGRMPIVPDIPGFGDSASPPGGGDADAVVEPLADGLAQMLGDNPVDVVAFSFGGLVAVLLAASMPHRVSKLLLAGAPVVPLARGRGVDLKPWSFDSTSEARMAVHRHNLKAIMLHRDASIDDFTLALQSANVTRDRMRKRRLVTTSAFRDGVLQLRCPFRAIYGEEDALYRGIWEPISQALAANALFEGITMVPDCGHWVQFEEPAQFNEWMLKGLRGL